MTKQVDFGFADISPAEKTKRVGEVFDTVAPYYDVLNDLMSGGMHRLWKTAAAALLDVHAGMKVLDIAAGSGDMTQRLAAMTGGVPVVAVDINPAMLAAARRRQTAATLLVADGEALPFAAGSFDRIMIAFGLRNVSNRQRLLCEIHRVLKTGGKYAILEFSPAGYFPYLQRLYLTRTLPLIGQLAADDSDSYRYLGESILRFPTPQQLSDMLAAAGLPQASVNRFAAGNVCLHHGRRYQ